MRRNLMSIRMVPEANTLYGYDGDDYLEGNSGNDMLTSGKGRDTLDDVRRSA